MKSRLFTYKFRSQLGPSIMPAIGLLLFSSAILFIVATTILCILESTGCSGNNNSFVSIIVVLLILSLFDWIWIALHLSRPSVEIREDGFRLRTLFYKSKWFSWEDISGFRAIDKVRAVNLPTPNVYIVESRKLNFFFLLVGIQVGNFNRGFAIHNNIENIDELLKIFQTKRPDLFSV